MPVIVHLPHVNKPAGIRRIAEILEAEGADPDRVLLDHNTEETVAAARRTGCYCGFTVYPISKLTPQRVSAIIREYGADRMIVDGSADWGVSDPLSLPKVVEHMRQDGHDAGTIQRIVFDNAMTFYSTSPRWKPRFDLAPIDPREFQR